MLDLQGWKKRGLTLKEPMTQSWLKSNVRVLAGVCSTANPLQYTKCQGVCNLFPLGPRWVPVFGQSTQRESRHDGDGLPDIFYQQFLKWLKTCSKCWQICWLCRKADVLSNLGQRGKDAERWSAGTAVTVWLVSVTLVSWWLQERKQDLVQDDDGEDEDDT